MDVSIKTENLTKIYEVGEVKVHALRDVNLKIKKREFIAVIGPSGSGKSTLLHILGGLDRATNGRVFIDHKDITQLSEDELAKIRSEKIGFVYQFHNLIPTLTALENVELPMVFRGIKKHNRKGRAKKLLENVGLGYRLKHTPVQLSGGEQQRVAIARALANNPSIILADEPTGELDSKSGAEVLAILKRLNKEKGITLVVVTHDYGVASNADRILYMLDGRLWEKGGTTSHEVKNMLEERE